MQIDEAVVVKRALALRAQKRIGVLWADAGRYFVSEHEADPYGSRVAYSLESLARLVGELEDSRVDGRVERKPPASKTALRRVV